MKKPLMSLRPFSWFAIHLLLVFGVVHAAIEPDFLMDSDPALQVPDPVKNFTLDHKGLWVQALERPEADMQRKAAETIARGHQYGIPNLIETVPTLEKVLLGKSTHPAARFAAARALVVLESRSSADKLLEASQEYGSDIRQIVEPALGLWDIASVRGIWIKRLETPGTRHRDLILAIRGLGRVHETSALPILLTMVLDLVRGSDVRLEAALAAGKLADSGLEKEADRLRKDDRSTQLISRVCSIRLLSQHSSDDAQRLLTELATDNEPLVAAAALERLNQIDPALVLPLAETAMKNVDQHVREQGVAAYLRLPTVERLGPLSQMLNDADPKIRRNVCENLFRLAEIPELADPIRDSAMNLLAGEVWQSQEQAALLLGLFGHKPSASRLVELLESTRPEVMVASAWALRKLAIPETLPAMIDKARRQTESRLIQYHQPGLDHQVAHLFEAFGLMKAIESVPLLIKYVPKNELMGERSRCAAIWTLGWLTEGVPNEKLSRALMDRIDDPGPPDESILVKQICAITIARTKDVEYAPVLRATVAVRPPATRLALAKLWAVKHLTGEDLPAPLPSVASQGIWFLEPLP